ncbi:MAG TPA: histidine kinase [Cyanothece sp. UBA12306]|nr:histidine kinase [Cyanothece sp. UBA12306]
MSTSVATFPNPSQDFISLCQSQLSLLTTRLKPDWTGIYLTQENKEGTQTNLIPVVFYPPTDNDWSRDNPQNLVLADSSYSFKDLPGLPGGNLAGIDLNLEQTIIQSPEQPQNAPYQLVLPLMHQEVMIGFLVIERKHLPWQPEELTQVKTIARTLAIAGLLDRRQNWYQEQLTQQNLLKQQESDRLHDLFHQLRNPLTALRVFSKLLLKRLFKDEKSSAIVDNIIRESDHLEELIKSFDNDLENNSVNPNILTLNAATAVPSPSLNGANELTLVAVNVKDILEPLLVSAEPIAQEKGIELTSDIPQKLSDVYTNFQALREVLINLIDNAIKYTPKGGQIKIELGLLSVIEEKTYQGIAISDTGLGISPEDQEHIFERHYRGIQEKGDIMGSGLGLAIVKDLIDQMHGIIEVLSPIDAREKKGTKFLVWLPLHNQ